MVADSIAKRLYTHVTGYITHELLKPVPNVKIKSSRTVSNFFVTEASETVDEEAER